MDLHAPDSSGVDEVDPPAVLLQTSALALAPAQSPLSCKCEFIPIVAGGVWNLRDAWNTLWH